MKANLEHITTETLERWWTILHEMECHVPQAPHIKLSDFKMMVADMILENTRVKP